MFGMQIGLIAVRARVFSILVLLRDLGSSRHGGVTRCGRGSTARGTWEYASPSLRTDDVGGLRVLGRHGRHGGHGGHVGHVGLECRKAGQCGIVTGLRHHRAQVG